LTNDAADSGVGDGDTGSSSRGSAGPSDGQSTAGAGAQSAAFAQEALRAFDFLTRASLEQLEQFYGVLQELNGGGGSAHLPQDWREQLQETVKRMLESESFTRLPDFASGPLRFGFMRDLQQLIAELSAANLEHFAVQATFQQTMADIHERTLRSLHRRVEERLAAGERIASLRSLYDLWVESGEEAFAVTAHSEDYGHLQAKLLNSAVGVRLRQQKLLEHFLAQWNLPSRAEFDALRAQVDALRAERGR
jgi:class III poly(R)-hydroxyalkanoic acid synthase PhaE subunit